MLFLEEQRKGKGKGKTHGDGQVIQVTSSSSSMKIEEINATCDDDVDILVVDDDATYATHLLIRGCWTLGLHFMCPQVESSLHNMKLNHFVQSGLEIHVSVMWLALEMLWYSFLMVLRFLYKMYTMCLS